MEWIEELKQKAIEEKNKGNVYAAALSLATLYHNHEIVDDPELFFNTTDYDAIVEKCIEQANKIIHWLSHGDRWDYEYLMIFEMRIAYQLISEYYPLIKRSSFLERRIVDVDDLLSTSLKHKPNYQAASTAAIVIFKSRKTDIQRDWLRGLYEQVGIKF